MKTYLNYFFYCGLLMAVTACDYGIEHESELVGADSITWTPDEDPIDPEIEADEEPQITDGVMDLESFQNEFDVYLDHKFDFGWRYITANYDEYPEDESLEHTEVKKDLDLSKVKAVSMEGDPYPIDFKGYAQAYDYMNGYHFYITYIQGEISEELHYYYVNAAFEIIHEGTLASTGGDEGSWSYSYGEFSKDFSVYHIYYADGEGKDTSDYGSDIIYFE